MLGPLFHAAGHKSVFWNEPSRLRPDGERFEAAGAFERWLASAERSVLSAARSLPVHVITHSVSVHAGLEISRRHRSRVASLVLVAPAMDVFTTYTNVLRLGQDDLTAVKPDIASAIADCLTRTRTVLDAAMREGMMNVLQDEQLLRHYWADLQQFKASLAAQSKPGGQFDAESFFAVLTDFGERCVALLSDALITIPTLVLFGARDPITPVQQQQRSIEAVVPGAYIKVIDGCSHYVHLDRPQQFIDVLMEWVTAHSQEPASREGIAPLNARPDRNLTAPA
jgi:pimeloyl-ACP methyl ester carboxylesterase